MLPFVTPLLLSIEAWMRFVLPVVPLVALFASTPPVAAQRTLRPEAAEQEATGRGGAAVYAPVSPEDALSPSEWRRVDESVDRGLAWLASQQQADGSFPSLIGGQPAVTSLAVMAFLSRGHRPGAGPYGEILERAVTFTLSCQEPNGLIVFDKLQSNDIVWDRRTHTATYNHAISGLMLGEVYGQGNQTLNEKIKPAIELALLWARKQQQRPPNYPVDVGGWRYLSRVSRTKPASDLSATGWFVMFFRSARNAEFEVPKEYVDDAIAFARRCYDPRSGGFFYGPHPEDRHVSRGMTGAGLLILTVSGIRDEQIARSTGEWLLSHPLDEYNRSSGGHDRFHYGSYYASQAMYMLGGDYWRAFYPTLASTMMSGQQGDGGWDRENRNDGKYGRCYSTSLAILSLTPPYQLLPIYQR